MKSTLKVFLMAVCTWASTAGFMPEPMAASKPIQQPFEIEVVTSVPLESGLGFQGIREAKNVWVEMIRSAKQTLDIEQFYVANERGQALEPVLREIVEASRRGVKVRFVGELKFFKTYPESIRILGAQPGIDARIIDYGALGGGGIQHSKFFIVDRESLFVGSHNFDWKALDHIHEVGYRIKNVALARQLGIVFERDFVRSKNVSQIPLDPTPLLETVAAPVQPATEIWAPEPTQGQGPIALLVSPMADIPQGAPATLIEILKLIKSAQRSVKVQVMEYKTSSSGQPGAPWNELDQALKEAAARGVQVHLIVSNTHVERALPELKSLAATPNVTVKFITIPQHSSGPLSYARLIHSKYMIIDGRDAWMGTENWSRGYFYNSRNVGFVSRIPTVTANLDRLYVQLFDGRYATRITP